LIVRFYLNVGIGKYMKQTSPPRPRPGTSLFRVGGGSGYSQGAKKGAPWEGVNDIPSLKLTRCP